MQHIIKSSHEYIIHVIGKGYLNACELRGLTYTPYQTCASHYPKDQAYKIAMDLTEDYQMFKREIIHNYEPVAKRLI